jgi:hypothetical protein
MNYLHPLLGSIDCRYISLIDLHRDWLENWQSDLEASIEHGDISMSECVNGALCELALTGQLKTDWLGVIDEYLGTDDEPLAYSHAYIQRLHKFSAQGRQSTISAIFSRWWISRLQGAETDHDKYADLMLQRFQPDGHFYDYEISETVIRHRMKLELTLNSTYAVQILSEANRIDSTFATELASSITNTKDIPSCSYLSTEYFRYQTLQKIGFEKLFPVGFDEFIVSLETGLPLGWSDFDLSSKLDAYMGTRKRTSRDDVIHSPLITNFVSQMTTLIEDPKVLEKVQTRLNGYSAHLGANPLDIPSFQMRDLSIPFGTGISILEAITASHLAGSV